MQTGTVRINPADASLVGAAIITQVLLLVILGSGAFILWNAEQKLPRHHRGHGPDVATFGWLLLGLLLLTIAPLVLTDAFAATWRAVYVGIPAPTFSTGAAMRLMFYSDIGAIAILIYQTGGSRVSAFGPLLFIVPALALFLRQSFGQVLVYSGLLFAAFWLMLYIARKPTRETIEDADYRLALQRADAVAYWWITLAALALTTLVAFVADPRWIRTGA